MKLFSFFNKRSKRNKQPQSSQIELQEDDKLIREAKQILQRLSLETTAEPPDVNAIVTKIQSLMNEQANQALSTTDSIDRFIKTLENNVDYQLREHDIYRTRIHLALPLVRQDLESKLDNNNHNKLN